MNSVNLTGKIDTDLVLKVSKSGVKYLQFSLLVKTKQRGQDGNIIIDSFDCVAFGDKADSIMNKSAKGNLLGVSGSLKKSKAGIVSVSISDVSFFEKKKEDFVLLSEIEQKAAATQKLYENSQIINIQE